MSEKEQFVAQLDIAVPYEKIAVVVATYDQEYGFEPMQRINFQSELVRGTVLKDALQKALT